jgi:glycosyltransferase involved in cell wall biosynthesis
MRESIPAGVIEARKSASLIRYVYHIRGSAVAAHSYGNTFPGQGNIRKNEVPSNASGPRANITAAKVDAEILIIDSSNDRTAEIAVAHGARVLKTPKRGLGRAYIDAISVIRGRYVLMGGADCTYEFRNIHAFVERFRSGSEFIMGSRFKGSIERGAMPPLHRYFGTPLTTWILNVMYGTHFSDIHCGMRRTTLDALKRINLVSQSWEYASEMVLKSVRLDLAVSEVPVNFLNAPEGRVSHLVQGGWSAPWKAGWINLKAIFVFGADFFLILN